MSLVLKVFVESTQMKHSLIYNFIFSSRDQTVLNFVYGIVNHNLSGVVLHSC